MKIVSVNLEQVLGVKSELPSTGKPEFVMAGDLTLVNHLLSMLSSTVKIMPVPVRLREKHELLTFTI